MSDQDELFKSKEPEGTPAPNPLDDLLKEIKTEDGRQKYNTVEDALKSLGESQTFIKTLLEEKRAQEAALSETKEELSKMKTIEEFASSIAPKTPSTPESKPAETPEGKGEGVKPGDIAELIAKELDTRSAQEVKIKNLRTVVDAVTESHGDKAAEHIKKVADEYGTTPEKLQELAQENPKLALTLLSPKSATPPTPHKPTLMSPRPSTDDNPIPQFERGAARGGLTNTELMDRWRQVKNYTNKRLGVEN